MKISKLVYSLLCFALILSSCDTAGDGQRVDEDTASTRADDYAAVTDANRDEDFVTDVIEANAEELAWLNAGINTGTDAELKSHAQQMKADHEQMDKELRDFAGKKNISLADIDTAAGVNLADRQGNEWDEEWADEMGDQHRRLIRRFERAERSIQESELVGIIQKTLPTLRSHMDMTEKLEEKFDKMPDR